MLYHSIYNIYFAAIFVALSNSTFSNSSFNPKWQIRSLHQGQFWLENEIIEKWLKPPFFTCSDRVMQLSGKKIRGK
jgi:hypothetical protein